MRLLLLDIHVIYVCNRNGDQDNRTGRLSWSAAKTSLDFLSEKFRRNCQISMLGRHAGTNVWDSRLREKYVHMYVGLMSISTLLINKKTDQGASRVSPECLFSHALFPPNPNHFDLFAQKSGEKPKQTSVS